MTDDDTPALGRGYEHHHPERLGAAADVLDGKMTQDEAATKYGLKRAPLREAVQWLSGYRLAASENIAPEDLPKTGQKKLDAALNRMKRQFSIEVRQQVAAQVDEWRAEHLARIEGDVKALKKRLDTAIRRDDFKISPDEYKALRLCLHPDSNATHEMRKRAWDAFNKLDVKPFTKEDLARQAQMEAELAEIRKQAGGR